MFVPKFVRRAYRRRIDAIPPEIKERWELVSGIMQAVGLVIGGCLCLAVVVSVLSNATIVEPKNAQEVLERVGKVETISYSIESVRTKNIDGEKVRQDGLVGVAVDLKTRRFQAQANGLTDATMRVVGDGKTALIKRGDNVPGKLGAYPAIDALRPIFASDIAKRNPKLITNTLTTNNTRGWLLTWEPDRSDVLRMMGVSLLALAGEDVAAIRAGKFSIDYATVSVVRSTKRLDRLDTVLEVNGAQLHLLVSYRNYDVAGLDDLSLVPKTAN
jgi:hypothetical protein